MSTKSIHALLAITILMGTTLSQVVAQDIDYGLSIGSTITKAHQFPELIPTYGVIDIDSGSPKLNFGFFVSKRLSKHARLSGGIEYQQAHISGSWPNLSIGRISFYHKHSLHLLTGLEISFDNKEFCIPLRVDIYPLVKSGLFISGGVEALWISERKNEIHGSAINPDNYEQYQLNDESVPIVDIYVPDYLVEKTKREDVLFGYGIGWDFSIFDQSLTLIAYRAEGNSKIYDHPAFGIGSRQKSTISLIYRLSL